MAGISLSLAPALRPATVVLQCPQIFDWDALKNTQLWELIQNGTAPLWVAGHTLKSFAHHLRFIKLEPEIIIYLQKAGGEWKSLLQAKGLWETIPPQIRAGGHNEILRFLSDKDWSHRIPRSQGGPTTADNGIFEPRLLNRMRGARKMTSEEIAAAKAVIRSDVVVSVVRQTLGAMVKGAIIGAIVGGLIACLECGLQYAERKITWKEMVTKIITRILIAGAASFIITGLLVGLGLIFPGLIPLLVVPMFVVRIVGLVFLAQHAISLGKRYWELLEKHGLIDEACQVLRGAEGELRGTVDELERSVAEKIREWFRSIADWIWGRRADPVAVGPREILGTDRGWVLLATQTDAVSRYASDTVSPLMLRGYAFDQNDILRSLDLPEINLPEIRVSIEDLQQWIARTVKCEFAKAICTAIQLIELLRACQEGADWEPSPAFKRCNESPLIIR